MKNLIKIIFLLFACIGYAQEGIVTPLNTLSMDVQNGTYIKDINGEFNPFVGTYEQPCNN
jgi:hypothetical protein